MLWCQRRRSAAPDALEHDFIFAIGGLQSADVLSAAEL
jgi:hypothetical protein